MGFWLDGDHTLSSVKRGPQRPGTSATADVENARV